MNCKIRFNGCNAKCKHETGKNCLQNPKPFHKLLDAGQSNQESPKKKIYTVNLKCHDLLEFRNLLWL